MNVLANEFPFLVTLNDDVLLATIPVGFALLELRAQRNRREKKRQTDCRRGIHAPDPTPTR